MHGSPIGAAQSVGVSVDVSVGVSDGVAHESTGLASFDPHAPVIHAPPMPNTSTASIAERSLVITFMDLLPEPSCNSQVWSESPGRALRGPGPIAERERQQRDAPARIRPIGELQ
jgi:hypothetical protein